MYEPQISMDAKILEEQYGPDRTILTLSFIKKVVEKSNNESTFLSLQILIASRIVAVDLPFSLTRCRVLAMFEEKTRRETIKGIEEILS